MNQVVSNTIGAFNYAALKPGDLASDGMVFVGGYEDSKTGRRKGLLRTLFYDVSYYDAKRREELKTICGNPVGTCHLPTGAEALLIRHSLTEESRGEMRLLLEAGNPLWIDGVNCEVISCLDLVTGKQGWRLSDQVVSVCLVRSVDL